MNHIPSSSFPLDWPLGLPTYETQAELERDLVLHAIDDPSLDFMAEQEPVLPDPENDGFPSSKRMHFDGETDEEGSVSLFSPSYLEPSVLGVPSPEEVKTAYKAYFTRKTPPDEDWVNLTGPKEQIMLFYRLYKISKEEGFFKDGRIIHKYANILHQNTVLSSEHIKRYTERWKSSANINEEQAYRLAEDCDSSAKIQLIWTRLSIGRMLYYDNWLSDDKPNEMPPTDWRHLKWMFVAFFQALTAERQEEFKNLYPDEQDSLFKSRVYHQLRMPMELNSLNGRQLAAVESESYQLNDAALEEEEPFSPYFIPSRLSNSIDDLNKKLKAEYKGYFCSDHTPPEDWSNRKLPKEQVALVYEFYEKFLKGEKFENKGRNQRCHNFISQNTLLLFVDLKKYVAIWEKHSNINATRAYELVSDLKVHLSWVRFAKERAAHYDFWVAQKKPAHPMSAVWSYTKSMYIAFFEALTLERRERFKALYPRMQNGFLERRGVCRFNRKQDFAPTPAPSALQPQPLTPASSALQPQPLTPASSALQPQPFMMVMPPPQPFIVMPPPQPFMVMPSMPSFVPVVYQYYPYYPTPSSGTGI